MFFLGSAGDPQGFSDVISWSRGTTLGQMGDYSDDQRSIVWLGLSNIISIDGMKKMLQPPGVTLDDYNAVSSPWQRKQTAASDLL